MLTLEEKRLRETARKRKYRAKWTPEQWEAHREAGRKYRAKWTPEQWEAHREAGRKHRAKWSPEEKRLRETARKRRQRAKWTPEQWDTHRKRALRNYYERKARRLAQQPQSATQDD